jgi:hypothetical protein
MSTLVVTDILSGIKNKATLLSWSICFEQNFIILGPSS